MGRSGLEEGETFEVEILSPFTSCVMSHLKVPNFSFLCYQMVVKNYIFVFFL